MGETREVDGGRTETSLLFKWTFLGWFGSVLEDTSHVCIPAINPEPFFRCHIKRRQTPAEPKGPIRTSLRSFSKLSWFGSTIRGAGTLRGGIRKESVRESEPTFSSSADDYYHNPHPEGPARSSRGGGGPDDYLFTQHGSCRSFVTPSSGVRIFPAAFRRHHSEVENKASEEETSRGACAREVRTVLLCWLHELREAPRHSGIESAEFHGNAILHPSDAPGAPVCRVFHPLLDSLEKAGFSNMVSKWEFKESNGETS